MSAEADCELCGAKLPTLTQLRRHLGKHHEELSLFALPSHIKEEDDEEADDDHAENDSVSSVAGSNGSPSPKQISCEQCGLNFDDDHENRQLALDLHMQNIHGHSKTRISSIDETDLRFVVPPPVPEIPTSPTYSSASSHSQLIYSTDSGEPEAHWAMKILDGRHPSTPYHTLGERTTECLGRDVPRVLELLNTDGFTKVLEMPFESTDVWVRLYWRAEDNRARILFLTKDASGCRMRCCVPLTGLKILRVDNCLQLCRIDRKDGQLNLWARLRFVLHESKYIRVFYLYKASNCDVGMVLFYSTAVALKCQDAHGIAEDLDDFFDPGEKIQFSR
jgi:hypothetical protein